MNRDMTDSAPIAALEDRIAELEAAAVRFETTHREWEKFSNSWNEFGAEFARRQEELDVQVKRKEDEAQKRRKSLWEQLDRDRVTQEPPLDQVMELLRIRNEDSHFRRQIERNFADLKRTAADLTSEIRKLNAPRDSH
jgi:hypothetical protein